MSQEYIEITERTVSEAITAACQKLAVPSERLEYEVIDQGKTGFLGIGSRAARIRVRVKQGMTESTQIDTSAIINDVLSGKAEEKVKTATEKSVTEKNTETAKPGRKETHEKKTPENRKAEKGPKKDHDRAAVKKEEAPVQEKASEKVQEKVTGKVHEKAQQKSSQENDEEQSRDGMTQKTGSSRRNSGKRDNSERGERNQEKGYRDRSRGHRRARYSEKEEADVTVQGGETKPAGTVSEAKLTPRKRTAAPSLTPEQIEDIKNKAVVFLMDVFHAMDLEAEISTSYDKENGILSIDMNGENMGVLIGKRGQTLDSLQYLVSLVVNKGVEGYIHVKADTENYRERRKKTLENLAKNIASKVKRNRSSVALEPMNPYERRIIHSALQGDRYVTTYSEGEEPYRKVIVTMKEDR